MTDHRTIEVELDEGEPCKACGAIGAHFCVGKRGRGSTTYIGVRKAPFTQEDLEEHRKEPKVVARLKRVDEAIKRRA